MVEIQFVCMKNVDLTMTNLIWNHGRSSLNHENLIFSRSDPSFMVQKRLPSGNLTVCDIEAMAQSK